MTKHKHPANHTSASSTPPHPESSSADNMKADGMQSNAVRAGPAREQIAARAYEIFLARGGQHGKHNEDWMQAERELRLGKQ